jgi:hypothetical protein
MRVRKKRRRPDSNRGIKALQASALPLGYGAKKEGLHVLRDGLTPLPKRETGLEPATPTLARWCSTN